jgi:hypothetical protein
MQLNWMFFYCDVLRQQCRVKYWKAQNFHPGILIISSAIWYPYGIDIFHLLSLYREQGMSFRY